MRPDDPFPNGPDAMAGDPHLDIPLDADVQALDEELRVAGEHARRSHHGRTQATRVFTVDLRARLMAGFHAQVAGGGAASASAALPVDLGAAPVRMRRPLSPRTRPDLVLPGETWAPTALDPTVTPRAQLPALLPRARWSLLAAAALTTVLVAGALGASFDWLLPAPTLDPSRPPSSPVPVIVAPSPDSSLPAVAVTSPEPATPAPEATKKPAATPKPRPTPSPTPKPEPTQPPVGPMSLAAKPCPGGVVLDWTKPGPEVSHYHVLRKVGGDVPPSYPSGGTEVATATTWNGETDGFDASVDPGLSVTYRAFAFDSTDDVIQYSPSRTVTTTPRIELGGLGQVAGGVGSGSITFSWAAPGVPAACFSYGKLVGSLEDPNPSYLTGAEPLAVIGEQATTEVTVARASGTTMWVRYEVVRATSTGKFIVAHSDVVQVTFP